MNSKCRLDYLTPNVERQVAFGGKSHKLNAVVLSLLGTAVLAFSFLILRNERLQIQYYVGSNPRFVSKPFPNILLGCCAATITSSIVQTISSLMFLFEDITVNVWKWVKFTVFMVFVISVMMLTLVDSVPNKNQKNLDDMCRYPQISV
ncbi:hypothetical protein Ocin01_10000 [Orchesella cincta]|uniref:Uncharacterized protein n=1 Tax=Orchesella cincta TaxID=48709 RepID=A0A1D2MUB7_ORCCI|nr:hypothetical protein Ocin01_10000 [Orchesella cincta]